MKWAVVSHPTPVAYVAAKPENPAVDPAVDPVASATVAPDAADGRKAVEADRNEERSGRGLRGSADSLDGI